MKPLRVPALSLTLIFLATSVYGEQLDTYRQLKEWTPYFLAEKGKTYATTYYEYSRINIGSRKVDWQLLTERVTYKGEKWIPYLEFAHHDRDRLNDFTLDAGSYVLAGDTILQGEIGFGMETDFIYRFQGTVQAEHPLVGHLYGKVRARYLHYELSDVVIFSPAGLTYYLGNHYLTADYNFSVTENRGDAHFFTARGNYVVHPRLHLYGGVAAGQRLFDIFPVGASHQESYIFFGGANIRFFENVQVSVGYSYAQEQPSFIKRSIETAISFKF